MKALLTAIRAKLRTSLTGIRDTDIFIAPSADYVPAGAKFPAIGIKDGPVERRERIGGVVELALRVEIVAWVEINKPEASIMGDATRPGILDVTDDVQASLIGDTLGLDGILYADLVSETATELAADDKSVLVRKSITLEYIKEIDDEH